MHANLTVLMALLVQAMAFKSISPPDSGSSSFELDTTKPFPFVWDVDGYLRHLFLSLVEICLLSYISDSRACPTFCMDLVTFSRNCKQSWHIASGVHASNNDQTCATARQGTQTFDLSKLNNITFNSCPAGTATTLDKS